MVLLLDTINEEAPTEELRAGIANIATQRRGFFVGAILHNLVGHDIRAGALCNRINVRQTFLAELALSDVVADDV